MNLLLITPEKAIKLVGNDFFRHLLKGEKLVHVHLPAIFAVWPIVDDLLLGCFIFFVSVMLNGWYLEAYVKFEEVDKM